MKPAVTLHSILNYKKEVYIMKNIIITISGFCGKKVFYFSGLYMKEKCEIVNNYRDFITRIKPAYKEYNNIILCNEYGETLSAAEFNDFIQAGL